jgi:spore germination protein KA
MIKKILKKLKFLQLLRKNYQKNEKVKEKSSSSLSSNLDKNIKIFRANFGASSDLIIRKFTLGFEKKIPAAIIYIDGLIDKKVLNSNILQTLMIELKKIDNEETALKKDIIETIYSKILTVTEIKRVKNIYKINQGILSGETAILIEGRNETLLIDTRNWAMRAIEEPDTEVMVRGPREGFSENLRTNTSLLRRKIKNHNLVFEDLVLGEQTRTTVCIACLQGITRKDLINEVKKRLKQIDTDAILESGYIEQFIEDNPFSLFATIGNSERPDKVAAKLLEGRVAILIDGTPFVLTVPMLFIENFQVSEDYYFRPFYTTLIRWVRYISFLISILAPGVYVAITTYHQELIPTPLFITMAAAEEGTPFPSVLDALIMGSVYEILREAGIRLPRQVGQAISIVGALVIGESAVSAGLIGAPMVIVVALTAIASFVVPSLTDVGAIIRLFLVFLAGVLGGYGILLGLLVFLVHLASLRSFGIPYLSPITPLNSRDLKDVVIRPPLWAIFTRPESLENHNLQRQEFHLKPEPPSDEEKKD